MTEQAKVNVDQKALKAVQTGLKNEIKNAVAMRRVYADFGAINARAIESIGGTFDESTRKYKGYDTKVLNAWRVEAFPTMVKGGKLKDTALFSHSIAYHVNAEAIDKWLAAEGLDHLYRPDTIMKKYSAHVKQVAKESAEAAETPDEKDRREWNEDRDKFERLLQGMSGPMGSIVNMAIDNKLTVDEQRKFADMLVAAFAHVDGKVADASQDAYQAAKAAEHDKVRTGTDG